MPHSIYVVQQTVYATKITAIELPARDPDPLPFALTPLLLEFPFHIYDCVPVLAVRSVQ